MNVPSEHSSETEYRVCWKRKDGAEGAVCANSERDARRTAAMYRGSDIFEFVRMERRELRPWMPFGQSEERCS